MNVKNNAHKPDRLTRRQFIYYSSMAASAAALKTRAASPAPRTPGSGDKLRIAAVGAGGKGDSDIQCCSGEQIVAICDADQRKAAGWLQKLPNAKFYFDWREMLEKEEKNIDAVTVSIPDHSHAVVAAT